MHTHIAYTDREGRQQRRAVQARTGFALPGETTSLLPRSTQQSDVDEAATQDVPTGGGGGEHRPAWHPSPHRLQLPPARTVSDATHATDALSSSLPTGEGLRLRTSHSRDTAAALSSLSTGPGSWVAPMPRTHSTAADNPLSSPAPCVLSICSDERAAHGATTHSTSVLDTSPTVHHDVDIFKQARGSLGPAALAVAPPRTSAASLPKATGCQRLFSRLRAGFASKSANWGRKRSSRQGQFVTVYTTPQHAAQSPCSACNDALVAQVCTRTVEVLYRLLEAACLHLDALRSACMPHQPADAAPV